MNSHYCSFDDLPTRKQAWKEVLRSLKEAEINKAHMPYHKHFFFTGELLEVKKEHLKVLSKFISEDGFYKLANGYQLFYSEQFSKELILDELRLIDASEIRSFHYTFVSVQLGKGGNHQGFVGQRGLIHRIAKCEFILETGVKKNDNPKKIVERFFNSLDQIVRFPTMAISMLSDEYFSKELYDAKLKLFECCFNWLVQNKKLELASVEEEISLILQWSDLAVYHQAALPRLKYLVEHCILILEKYKEVDNGLKKLFDDVKPNHNWKLEEVEQDEDDDEDEESQDIAPGIDYMGRWYFRSISKPRAIVVPTENSRSSYLDALSNLLCDYDLHEQIVDVPFKTRVDIKGILSPEILECFSLSNEKEIAAQQIPIRLKAPFLNPNDGSRAFGVTLLLLEVELNFEPAKKLIGFWLPHSDVNIFEYASVHLTNIERLFLNLAYFLKQNKGYEHLFLSNRNKDDNERNKEMRKYEQEYYVGYPSFKLGLDYSDIASLDIKILS
jgi:hypothetical protein